MKIKVELEKGETIEQAEEFMAKSVAKKAECSNEQYADGYLNEFHSYICKRHKDMLEQILDEVKQEVERDAHSKSTF